jgi:hypothetical protein
LAKPHFPKSEAEFTKWFERYHKTFSGNAKGFKFTAAQVKAGKAAWANWQKWYKAWHKAHAAERAAWKQMSKARTSCESWAGKHWNFIWKNSFNSGQFAWFGIPAFKSTANAAKPKKASAAWTESPWMKVDWSGKGKNTVWVWASSHGQGKWPAWATGACVQFRRKGGRWQTLSKGKSWPFMHVVGTGKAAVEYRAAWFGKGGKFGPWSKTSTFPSKKAA